MNIIPEGYYTAVAVHQNGEDGNLLARFGESGNGTKQVLIYFEVIEGDYAGTRVPWFGFFTTAAWQRTIESLRYCGLKGDDLSTINQQELNQRVTITIEHNEQGDKVYPRVSWVNRPGGSTIKLKKPMGTNELRGFAAQMKSYLQQVEEVAGEKGAAGAHLNRQPREDAFADASPPTGDGFAGDQGWNSSAAAPADYDDIPF